MKRTPARKELRIHAGMRTHLAFRADDIEPDRVQSLQLYAGPHVAEIAALFQFAGPRAQEIAPLLAAAIAADTAAKEPDTLQAVARHLGHANLAVRVFSRTLWASAPVPGFQEWTVVYRLIPQNGVPVVAELRIVPTTETANGAPREEWRSDSSEARGRTPTNGLTWKVVRSIALGADKIASQKVMNAMQTRYGNELFEPSGLFGRHGFSEAPGPVTSSSVPRKRGRIGFDETFYAEFARDYVRARQINPRSPVALVAHTRRIKQSRARDMVRRARELGLLTPGQPGRPGGILTDKARRLLKRTRRLDRARNSAKED